MTTVDRSVSTDDAALKAGHRAIWSSGDYATLAAELVAGLGTALVAAGGVGPGIRVLDVAAGAGNAAIPAAEAGAHVVAGDLTPQLLEMGRAAATERGLRIDWQEADAEALPFADSSFDTVLSCVGVMFAPHHQQAADELVRVCRPGGTIALLNWTPEGFIGQLFAIMKPFAPPLPPGAQPAPLWGVPEHVQQLLGDRVEDLHAQRQSIDVSFASGTAFREYFKHLYGPVIAVYRKLADDPVRVAELDSAIAELGQRNITDGVMRWEYLLLTARRVSRAQEH